MITCRAQPGRTTRTTPMSGRRPVAALGVAVLGIAALAACSASPSAAGPASDAAGGQGLTAQRKRLALDVARHEAKGSARTVRTAVVTVGPGRLPVGQSNTGHGCTSGTLLHVTLIGSFRDIAVSPPSIDPSAPPQDFTVTAVDLTADARTGDVCLESVRTGPVSPDPGATVLFGS